MSSDSESNSFTNLSSSSDEDIYYFFLSAILIIIILVLISNTQHDIMMFWPRNIFEYHF